MTKTKHSQDEAEKVRLSYYRNRNERLVSFVVEDIRLKQKIAEAAELDGRSVNSWIIHHILPKIEEELQEQLTKNVRR